MKNKRIISIACVLAVSTTQLPTAFASSHDDYVNIALDTAADINGGLVSVNVPVTIDGKELRLVATGLRKDNKDAFVSAIKDNFSLSDDTPVYISDNAFVDAEKWSIFSPVYDDSLCWAASAANVLWLSDWGRHYSDPQTGEPFTSEDSLFEYYTKNFINKGGETDQAIDWFFMGVFFVSGAGSHSSPIDQQDKRVGVEKGFVSTLAQTNYDLIKAPEDISKLLDLDRQSDSAGAFGVGVGDVYGNEPGASTHAIAASGIIYDPNETALKDKYKAIILIDSDNDGEPGDYDNFEEVPDSVRMDSKTSRPNSYTVYDLKLRTLKDGENVWEIVNYSPDPDYPYVIYSLDKMPLYSTSVIDENTETEGTRAQYENVDLITDYIFTTNSLDKLSIPFKTEVDSFAVREFYKNEPINLNIFVANKSGTVLDKDYKGGNTLTFDWSVTRRNDGTKVYSGSEKIDAEVFWGTESAFFLNLNNKDGKVTEWAPGDYTVTLSINADRAVLESYYLNNTDESFDFTVLDEDKKEEDITPAPEKQDEEPTIEIEDEDTDPTDPKDDNSDSEKDSSKKSKKNKNSSNSSTNDTKGSTDTSDSTPLHSGTNTENPKTGAAAALSLSLPGLIMLVLGKKRK